ncbi:hypothetical protein B0H10DRAFT_568804 [Mycena sp. CBHHK59/15]|nr:hypothetical protein B0H10DRAFT_568804 [Mycena sp. CBHHK59/15]
MAFLRVENTPLSSSVFSMLEIPVEIMSEIFTHCLPESICAPDIKNAPLLLTRVSRRWRTIALSTPVLWRSLGITSSKSSTHLLKLDAWLSRARNQPLYLSFDATIDSGSMDILNRHAEMWYDMTITGQHLSQLALLNPNTTCLRILQRLDISIRSGSGIELAVPTFQDAPALRHLQIHFLANTIVSQIVLPWEN